MTTPVELLERVKGRIKPLLLEDELLEAKLLQALQTYQDTAGHISRVTLSGEELIIPYPDDYLELVHIENMQDGIHLELTRSDRAPFVMTYLVRLDNVEIKTWQMPPTITGMIGDYLEALIKKDNSPRARRVLEAGKVNTVDIPDENTLEQRLRDLEQKMASNRHIFFGATIFPQ